MAGFGLSVDNPLGFLGEFGDGDRIRAKNDYALGQQALTTNASLALEESKQRNKLITGIAIGFGILVAIVATVFALK